MYALLRPQLNAAAQRKRGGKGGEGEEEEEEGRSGKGITQAANLNAFYIALFMQAPSLPPSPSRSHVSTSKKGRTRRREQARGVGRQRERVQRATLSALTSIGDTA